MAHPTIDGWRRALAAVLIFALALAGAGRAMAAVESITGRGAPICHSGGGAPADPAAPPRHDCCDACALLTAAVLPAAPPLAVPTPVRGFAERAGPPSPAPRQARRRGPCQARAPPRG